MLRSIRVVDARGVEVFVPRRVVFRRRAYVFLAAALLALVFGVSVGVAKSGPGQVRAAIVYDSFNPACPGGYGAKNKKIGTATAIRKKGLATFRGKLHGAAPGDYVANLYDANCNFLLQLGSFKVDGSGDGNFAKQLFLSFGQGFFLDFYNQDRDIHNSTATFKLGSSGTSPGAPGADLGVTKSVNDSSPNVGDTVTFTVTVTNAGPITATGVAVTDLLPAGLTFVSATASEGSYNAATGVWTVGAVLTGSPRTLTIQATVVSPTPGANTAAVMHADQFDPNTGNNSASVSLNVQTADLALAKTVDNPTPTLGGTVTFTLALTDNGPITATGVRVNDLLPAGLTFVSATPSQGSYNAATGLWTAGTLTTGSSATLALQAQVVSPNPQTNTAAISHADQFDPVTANNTASATETPLQADLAVTKTVSNSTPNVGDNVTFTVTLTDGGPGDATGVQVNDLLPAGLTLLTATPSQGSYNSATGLWDVGTVTTGSPRTLGITAQALSPNPQTNTATISHADQFDPNPGNNTASVTETPQRADLALTKTVDNPTPIIGNTVHFTVTLTDIGPDPATNVTVGDLLPPGLLFVSATPSQGTYISATGVWTVGTVTTSTPATLAITAQVVPPPPWTNTATITHADQFDPNLANNGASVALQVPADLALSKTVNDPTPNVGDAVAFTVTLTNLGPSLATGVKVSDLVPAGLSGVVVFPFVGTYDPGTGVWDVGTIVPGPVILAISGTVNSLPLSNTATITHADEFDPNPGNNSASVMVPTLPATHFVVSAPASVTAGQPFTFTVTALDQFNNTAAGYVGTVHFTSSDAGVILPADSTLTNGTGTFSATLNTAGPQTITATDTAVSSITGTSNTITVG
jgi:uncharacterized repeat protein (TIGR01451 family)